MSIRQRMKTDLLRAMKEHNRGVQTALRSLLAAIDNAEAVQPGDPITPIAGTPNEVVRRQLTEEDVLAILDREANRRRSTVETYRRLNQQEAARALQVEVDLIQRYLSIEETVDHS